MRYGLGIKILGEYDGSLSNGGEQIILRSSNGAVLADFIYNDASNWPGRADGDGATLEAIDPHGDLSNDDSWRSSTEYLGTPGREAIGPMTDICWRPVRWRRLKNHISRTARSCLSRPSRPR